MAETGQIRYHLHEPWVIDQPDWWDLQKLQRQAFIATLDKTEAEIENLVKWDDSSRYYNSHLDPNTEVGKDFYSNQEFSQPKVVIAVDSTTDEDIGFAYSAYNVSGETEAERAAKKKLLDKNYLWFREIAVRPDYQRQRVGLNMARKLLEPVNPKTPVTVYTWPDEIKFMNKLLSDVHMNKTHEAMVSIYGEGSEPVRQVRYLGQAGLIKAAIDKMLEI